MQIFNKVRIPNTIYSKEGKLYNNELKHCNQIYFKIVKKQPRNGKNRNKHYRRTYFLYQDKLLKGIYFYECQKIDAERQKSLQIAFKNSDNFFGFVKD